MIVKNASESRDPQELYDTWLGLRARRPQLRAVDYARELGVSELAVVAARVARDGTRPLAPAPAPLLAGVAQLGPVTASTRSAAAVLENAGSYGMPDIGEHTGIVIGDGIDLRVFPSGWAFAYALIDAADGGVRRSLQIFDGDGAASHTIALRPQSDLRAFDELVSSLAFSDAAPPAHGLETLPVAVRGAAVDVTAYRAAFAAMQDTHDFFMLLHRFGLEREEGLHLAGPEFARPLARDAHRRLFASAAERSIPLMLFVSSRGMVQISSGTIPKPTFGEARLDLIDPRFTLHVHEPAIARGWAVRKPTVNGSVTSLELYGAAGALVLQVFGERHEGQTERTDWSAAMAALPGLDA